MERNKRKKALADGASLLLRAPLLLMQRHVLNYTVRYTVLTEQTTKLARTIFSPFFFLQNLERSQQWDSALLHQAVTSLPKNVHT